LIKSKQVTAIAIL